MTARRFAGLDADKLRGGYYTPDAVAAWLCAWAVRDRTDSVLEPSCGDGVFLAAAAVRLGGLGAPAPAIAGQLAGVEIVPAEAAAARVRLLPCLGAPAAAAAVATGDFFDWWQRPARPAFDAVVGNPPFIRYQSFPEPSRGRAMGVLACLGLAPNRLTNAWVPFVAAAAASLRVGGRLAMVLPAELLAVSYSAQLRSFLRHRFRRLAVVACNELLFERAEQEVVLLLADGAVADGAMADGATAAAGAGGTAARSRPCRVTLTEVRTAGELTRRPPPAMLGMTAGALSAGAARGDEKWLQYFLTAREIGLLRELRRSGTAAALGSRAGVDVGVVTGSNEFFVLSQARVEDLGLSAYTVPLVSRSAQLPGARIAAAEWRDLAAEGHRVHLLNLRPLDGSRLAPPLAAYVAGGEARGIHRGYKCSIRAPWYAVPPAWVPDAFLFRQIYDFPRAVHNQAGATSTDTLHRLTCKADPAATIADLYTHLTAASAEIEGRSYGGGVLELEPTEAERLLVPPPLSPAPPPGSAPPGSALPLAECDRLVRAGRLDDALGENDRLVLGARLGLSRADCAALRGIWTKLRDRRIARRRRGRRAHPARNHAMRAAY
jgi:adenine-specific DNA-methyltransferase